MKIRLHKVCNLILDHLCPLLWRYFDKKGINVDLFYLGLSLGRKYQFYLLISSKLKGSNFRNFLIKYE